MTVFYERTAVQLHATFKDLAGAVTDPTTVKITWVDPHGTEETRTYGGGGSPEIAKASTGVYTIDIDVGSRWGTWRYFWHSEGEGQAAQEGEFDVKSVDFV